MPVMVHLRNKLVDFEIEAKILYYYWLLKRRISYRQVLLKCRYVVLFLTSCWYTTVKLLEPISNQLIRKIANEIPLC